MNENILAANALSDARDLALNLGREFTDADVSTGSLGDLMLAATHYVKITEDDNNNFLRSVKTFYANRGTISVAQARAILNMMRKDLLKSATVAEDGEVVSIDPRESKVYRCYKCNAEITGITALRSHKQEHVQQKPAADGVEVIADDSSVLGLDISELPNGYYALPDPTGKHAFVYLMVRRTTRRVFRDRRYRFGKVVVGGEWIEPGTIEVKEWSQDAKRLCGQMKPGDCYRGEFESLFPMLLANPKVWAVVFGQQIGRCGRCGKTLTDDVSRAAGIGPECVKKDHDGYWSSFGKKVNLHGADLTLTP